MSSRVPVLFLSHGGGPLPLLGDPQHASMLHQMQVIAEQLPSSEAIHNIVVVSAHWEAQPIQVTSHPAPDLIYDYYGFEPAAYQLKYPAPGNPLLAERIVQLLDEHKVCAEANPVRGLDHGVYVPLKLLWPEANIPVVQISLHPNLDAQYHIALGASLRSLRDEGCLIIGSGFSFHNLPEFFKPTTSAGQSLNQAFTRWLDQNLSEPLTLEERRQRFVDWQDAPGAHYSHPRAEHLMPLHVCLGAAGANAIQNQFCFEVMGVDARSYLWH